MAKPPFTGFAGVYTAIVTPFSKDGALDLDALARLVDEQVAGGVTGIVPCGTTGESPTLSHEEHREVIRFGARHAENGVVKVILWPGLMLQKVTTRPPEDGMLEVAIAAFKRVLATDKVIPESELDPAIVVVDTAGKPIVPALEPEPVLT